MTKIKEVKYDPAGFTIVDDCGHDFRELPNSDPGKGRDNPSYQEHPWDRQPTPKTTI